MIKKPEHFLKMEKTALQSGWNGLRLSFAESSECWLELIFIEISLISSS